MTARRTSPAVIREAAGGPMKAIIEFVDTTATANAGFEMRGGKWIVVGVAGGETTLSRGAFHLWGNLTNDLINLGGDAVGGLRSVSLSRPIEAMIRPSTHIAPRLPSFLNEKPDYGSLLTHAPTKITAEGIRQARDALTGRPSSRDSRISRVMTPAFTRRGCLIGSSSP